MLRMACLCMLVLVLEGSAAAAAAPTTTRVRCADRADCTAELQAALFDEHSDHVVIPNDRGHLLWPSHQLVMNRSNMALTLEPGVILQSVRCTPRDNRSCEGDSQTLLASYGVSNVTVSGPGASVRMWRADYVLNPFNISGLKGIEARTAIGLYDSRNITVEGLEIAESGGDGICMTNVIGGTIRNVTVVGAYRDALTVSACHDLLIENCTLLSTGGPGKYNGGQHLTASNGGIAGRCAVDIEPDSQGQTVMNLTFRNVIARLNVGSSFEVHGDTNHSILFENVHAEAAGGGSSHAWYLARLISPGGSIVLRSCSATNFPGAAIYIQRGEYPMPAGQTIPPRGSDLTVTGFRATNVATLQGVYAGHKQGVFPITIGRFVCPTYPAWLCPAVHPRGEYPGNSHLAPMAERMLFDDLEIHDGSDDGSDGRPFIGCNNLSSTFGVEPVACDPSTLWPLHGSASVWSHNSSACSVAGLGAAGAGLSVTCNKALKSDDRSGNVGSFPTLVKVMSNGSPTELWAAAKVAELLSLALVKQPAGLTAESGNNASTTATATTGSELLIGFGAATTLGGVSPAKLSALQGEDSYFMSTAEDGSVVIASSAASQRGTLNGIFAFLRVMGFRFLTRNATVVPHKPWRLPAAAAAHTFTPPLEQRDMDTSSAADLGRRRFIGDPRRIQNFSIFWPSSNYSAEHGLNGFLAFPPVGGQQAQANWGWGGHAGGGRAGFVATAYDLLSESLVADTSDCAGKGTYDPHPHNSPCLSTWRQHPEWFVCKPATCDLFVCPVVYPCTLAEVNKTYNSQPCWSNRSLQAAMSKNILRILRQNPDANIISVTGMDGSPVECPLDGIANREENTTGGANFRAVQNIAKLVNKEYPHVKLLTLAYQGSLLPPKHLKFGNNVIVQIAAPMDRFLPLSDPKNQQTTNIIKAWTDHCPTVYFWEYTSPDTGNVIPFANYFAQAKHIKELVTLGVKGYYGEGWPHPGVDMIDLKTYVASRTAFDPSLDTDGLITEFCIHFYSPSAAPHVREYMQVMATAFTTANSSMDYKGKPLSGDPSRHRGITNAIFGNRTMLSAAAALSAAKATAAPGQIYQLRLSQAMLNVIWVMLQRWEELQQFATANGIAWPLPKTKEAAYDEFAVGLTFAFENDEPGGSSNPSFLEHIPVSPGSSRYTSKMCDLACFKEQLGLGSLKTGISETSSLKSDDGSAHIPQIISVGVDATASEMHAAAELASFLCTINASKPGGYLVKNAEEVPTSAPQIAVGASAAMRLGVLAADLAGLGLEGYTMGVVNNGSSIVLTGGRDAPRGALYAVNAFLEGLGVRFLSVDVTKLPTTMPTIPASCKNHSFVPSFEYRQLMEWQAGPMMTPLSYDYAMHRRLDPSAEPGTGVPGEPAGDVARGGEIIYANPPGFVHTSYQLLDATGSAGESTSTPPPDLWRDHREWFWPRGSATDSPIAGQLCWSNASLQQFIIANLRTYLRAQPNATIVSVSQADNQFFCSDEHDLAIIKEEGTNGGALFRAVNVIADALQLEFPTVSVDTLAYEWSTAPPKITKPRPNVIIRACSIECNFAVPMTDPSNSVFRSEVEQWGRITNRTYIWTYISNLREFDLPFPNYYSVGANIKWYAANGVRGMYAEGTGYGSGGDLSEMKDYVMSSMLWNASLDPDLVIAQFLDDYYGKAAPFVREYMDILHGSIADTSYFMSYSFDSTAEFLSPITVVTAVKALRDGQALLSGEQASRLGGNMMPIYWVVMRRWSQLRQFVIAEGIAWPLEPTLEQAFHSFSLMFNFTKTRFDRAPSMGASGHDHDSLAWARTQLFGPGIRCLGSPGTLCNRVIPLAVTTQDDHYYQNKPTVFGAWESGVGPIPPAAATWIEFQLVGDYITKPIELAQVVGVVDMSPPGNSTHTLSFDSNVHVQTWTGYMKMGTVLTWTAPSVQTVSTLRMTTSQTPSWVSWTTIDIFGCDEDSSM